MLEKIRKHVFDDGEDLLQYNGNTDFGINFEDKEIY